MNCGVLLNGNHRVDLESIAKRVALEDGTTSSSIIRSSWTAANNAAESGNGEWG